MPYSSRTSILAGHRVAAAAARGTHAGVVEGSGMRRP